MTNKLSLPINMAIKQNEIEAYDWALQRLATELYWFCDFFNIAFFKDQQVPVPVISFEKTKVTMRGHYVPGRNQMGLMENININSAHLDSPLHEVLAILLHELCHSWQKLYGTPSNSWFHNKEFQLKMLEFGIAVNDNGCHTGVGDPFVYMLKRHGINFNYRIEPEGITNIPFKEKPKGKSKLKKWSCPCGQTARVGRKDFFATCDLCGEKFEMNL